MNGEYQLDEFTVEMIDFGPELPCEMWGNAAEDPIQVQLAIVRLMIETDHLGPEEAALAERFDELSDEERQKLFQAEIDFSDAA